MILIVFIFEIKIHIGSFSFTSNGLLKNINIIRFKKLRRYVKNNVMIVDNMWYVYGRSKNKIKASKIVSHRNTKYILRKIFSDLK